MTVFDRDERVLMNTLHALARTGLPGTEVLVVDDGSTIDYSSFWPAFEGIMPLRVTSRNTIESVEGAYHIGGHNNPAWVNNRALELVETEKVIFLSSDCIVQPHLFDALARHDLAKAMVSTRVVDLDSGKVYCGTERPFPMQWCLATTTKNAIECGGFDEEYVKGMAFEDADFSARLALLTGKAVIDLGVTSWHQSHPAVYYSDDGKGYKISEEYTKRKWGGGIPWARGGPMAYTTTEVGNLLYIRPKLTRSGAEAQAAREQIGV